jgi:hypothetical protein
MPEIKIDGVDLSHWQNITDSVIRKFKDDGCEFIFLKATDGKTGNDPKFLNYFPLVVKNKLIVGAYHFYEPISEGNLNGDQQANHLVDRVKIAVGNSGMSLLNIIWILDYEKYGIHRDDIDSVEGGEGDLRNAELFFETLISRLAEETGLIEDEIKEQAKFLFYSYHGFTSQTQLSPDSILMQDFIKWWIARYGKKLPVLPEGKKLWIWQQSQSKPFEGLTGQFDYDIVMVDNEEWTEWIVNIQRWCAENGIDIPQAVDPDPATPGDEISEINKTDYAN